LSKKLLLETQAYIVDHRRQLPAAKKHPFLFVASRTGQPLTLVAAKKLFVELRQGCSRLPKDLSAHVLRHTWNERFSEEVDKKGIDPETEKHIRSYLMGWAPTSPMAATYTRRHVQRKAREVSFALQTKLMNPGGEK
jgi:integrase